MQIFKHTNYDFLRWRWYAVALSWVVILAGVVVIQPAGLACGVFHYMIAHGHLAIGNQNHLDVFAHAQHRGAMHCGVPVGTILATWHPTIIRWHASPRQNTLNPAFHSLPALLPAGRFR